MAGFQHDLPIVVYACVEELYRTGASTQEKVICALLFIQTFFAGMTVPGLFRTPPDRKRHNELIDLFDTGPSFGRNLSLATESTPDICALLRSYIDRLPSPIWHESLFDAMWILCVLPSKQCESLLVQESEHEVNVNARERKKTKQTRPTSLIFFKKTVPDAKPTGDMHRTRSSSLNTNFSSSTLGPTASPEDGLSRERLQLAVSRILFRLLPRTNLALLAYLCAFFTQLPLSPQNQLGIEDVARLFAAPLFLGKPHSGVGEVRHGTATGATWAVRKEEACTMMVWILRRWAHISDGLFELDRSNDADGCGSVVEDTVAQDDCASATSSDSESVYSLLSMYAWPEADIRAHDETDTLLDAHDLNSNGQSISASVLTADMRPPPAQKSALVQQMESASSCMHPDVDFLTWKRVVEKDIDELRNALVDVRARLDQKTSPAT
ncbi:hypothetical protein EW145_g1791 [Phellinidium pouzarii]|uniref:Rho-GAP domain-containing protein n=1 Tax=Phellinidium pouzarii TaxID=167371 RepID=A0A4S4LD83_9AGAM|nr:hypothetical protein EW145_g1791 [Phellinidium pouzarii]